MHNHIVIGFYTAAVGILLITFGLNETQCVFPVVFCMPKFITALKLDC